MSTTITATTVGTVVRPPESVSKSPQHHNISIPSNPNNSSASDLISNTNVSITTTPTTISDNISNSSTAIVHRPQESQSSTLRPIDNNQISTPSLNNNVNNFTDNNNIEDFKLKTRASSEPFNFLETKNITKKEEVIITNGNRTTTSIQLHTNDESLITQRRQTYPQGGSLSPVVTSPPKETLTRKDSKLNELTTKEIQRMKYMLLNKRELKKNKKEFSDDSKMYSHNVINDNKNNISYNNNNNNNSHTINWNEFEKIDDPNKVIEGHSSFRTAYNMLTGIRVAVSRCSGIMKPLMEQDFKATKKLTFDITGNELTPSSKYDFKFKDYSPNVFRELRELFGLDPADYLVSLTAKYMVSEVTSPGKSGSFFYYSRDYKYIIKTIHRSEHKTLRRILKNYHHHVKNNPNTLVSQFYGLHRLKMPISFTGQHRKIYFIVMNNLFPPNKDIHRKYDLKGSLWKRETILNNETISKDSVSKKVLKDQNWLTNHEHISLGSIKRKYFIKQLEVDVEFLKKSNIMDYSLLVGIHDLNLGNIESINKSIILPVNKNKKSSKSNDNEDEEQLSFEEKFYFYSYECGFRGSNENNSNNSEIYYFGIIDCLTNYSMIKRAETFVKGFYQNRKEISAVPATEYGNRFLEFIKKRGFTEEI